MKVQHPNVSRLKSFEILPDFDLPDFSSDIVWKLKAEQERLMRILPDAPEGWHWALEMQQYETLGFTTSIIYRVVAELKEVN